MKASQVLLAGAAMSLALAATSAQALTRFGVTNLVSDGVVPARTIDPDLKNPWGVSFAPNGPFWISDNVTGVTTLYNGKGAKLPLTVTMQPAPLQPTGQVFNPTTSFETGGQTPLFLFATNEGTINAWTFPFGTNAPTAVDNRAGGASYTGLALGTTGGTDFLYAANFAQGQVDTFNGSFGAVPGGFVDPGLPGGYSPFNVQRLGNELYVTYAQLEPGGDEEVQGPGLGIVDAYNLNGGFLRRVVNPGGELNAPWGLAIAPATYGDFAGALLVGNLGDGTINAYDRTTGAFIGKLPGRDGQPLSFDGLWALTPGNDTLAGTSRKIYFTAGLDDETRGLFGRLDVVPEPATWLLMLTGFGLAGGLLRRRGARTLAV